MLKLALFVLPLGLDTFAVSAALGAAGLPKQQRLKIGLLLSGFEMAMPLVGLLIGHGLGRAIGNAADYLAAAALFAVGSWMLVSDEDDEAARLTALTAHRGMALVALGVSISLDELAMGFTIGLLHLPLLFAVVLIGAQAFLVAQLGLRLGARLREETREVAERIAGLALIALGAFILIENLT
jgi:putative Mn2+ efflux pump MntP